MSQPFKLFLIPRCRCFIARPLTLRYELFSITVANKLVNSESLVSKELDWPRTSHFAALKPVPASNLRKDRELNGERQGSIGAAEGLERNCKFPGSASLSRPALGKIRHADYS